MTSATLEWDQALFDTQVCDSSPPFSLAVFVERPPCDEGKEISKIKGRRKKE